MRFSTVELPDGPDNAQSRRWDAVIAFAATHGITIHDPPDYADGREYYAVDGEDEVVEAMYGVLCAGDDPLEAMMEPQ